MRRIARLLLCAENALMAFNEHLFGCLPVVQIVKARAIAIGGHGHSALPTGTPEQFRVFARIEARRWRSIIRDNGITLD